MKSLFCFVTILMLFACKNAKVTNDGASAAAVSEPSVRWLSACAEDVQGSAKSGRVVEIKMSAKTMLETRLRYADSACTKLVSKEEYQARVSLSIFDSSRAISQYTVKYSDESAKGLGAKSTMYFLVTSVKANELLLQRYEKLPSRDTPDLFPSGEVYNLQ